MKASYPILIAEDNKVSRKLLEDSLKRAGYTVVTTANGQDALNRFDRQFFPIVLTDWMMPEMDGLALCKAIRERSTNGYVFIVLLTARDSKEDIIAGLEAGVDDYLTKPLVRSELFARINNGIRILELEQSLKESQKKIKQHNEYLEDSVARRTAELKKSEEKYRTILENIEDGYYEIDLDGNFTFFNDSLCQMIGYHEHKLKQTNIRDITATDSIKNLIHSFKKVQQTGIPAKSIDWAIATSDGVQKHMESSISLIKNTEGQPSGFRGILRDVTEKKRLQDELIEKREMAEAASMAKSEFLANMSHEIRTPLNGIIGMTELVDQTELDNDHLDIFNTIMSEAEALLGVISGILDFSKIEAGKVELEHIPFDLQYMVEDVTHNIAYRAKKKDIECACFLSPDLPSKLLGDPGRIRQVLNNLLGNALKFTKQGEILIKVEKMEDLHDNINILFTVKDTGIGIPEDKLERVFDSFTQADGSHTRQYGGTGLGLSISRQLIELMGGEIDVESEIGKGTTFYFTAVFGKLSGEWPLKKKESVELEGLKVLIVDDNETNRNIFVNYLKSWGSRPVEASSSKEALAILNASISLGEPFNLVISDFQMPGENGFDLAKKVRANKELESLPFIVLTSVGMWGDGKTCKDIGIDAYITKPIRKGELKQGIRMVLTLPRASEVEEEQQLVTRHSIAEHFRKKNEILLVEDYPTNQKVALRHLQSAGYQVDLAENGRQAVDAYKQKTYDLILMDVQMPQMDGYEATRRIRNLERDSLETGENANHGKRIPIIALTAHAVKEDKDKCIQAGMDDYIAKPIKREMLLDRVGKWCLTEIENTKRNGTAESLKNE